MAVKIKICGVRTPEIAEAAIAAGADYIGMVFFEKSPRNIAADDAARLVQSIGGRVPTVAVLVDPDDALIDHIVTKVEPDYLQLHGGESPERLAAIKLRSGRSLIKAVPVAEKSDIDGARAYGEIADLILFDAKVPGARLPGGTGKSFDWTLLSGPDVIRPFGLSGGLDAGNVLEAIDIAEPDLIDVSSGVESAPGVKDEELIRAFISVTSFGRPERKRA
ncbi:phosphoribosylanthranilate isomerase [Methyloligella sp. 2.7D]|uniref:phosphoribosylanthranilate isomerase n=1 Tax=unclassified Methyloligella TaxID=2625955 RepID=UPI00157D403B|nr:phosphoribosylanthranilate isomerase [Methyloligella sp. GL2]QKP76063.1 phosphoribosylanthranilate isomerase [Methyloligella sp. GL2]